MSVRAHPALPCAYTRKIVADLRVAAARDKGRPMRSQNKLVVVLVAVFAGMAITTVWSQEGEGTGGTARTPSASPEARKYVAPPNQVVVIRAGRLFDSRSGRMLANPVIVVRGERIAEVGAGVQVPAGATVLDLGSATVLPGMIDARVHLHLNAPNP